MRDFGINFNQVCDLTEVKKKQKKKEEMSHDVLFLTSKKDVSCFVSSDLEHFKELKKKNNKCNVPQFQQ